MEETSRDMLGLAERCEKATGPDRDLDEAIQVALAGAAAEWQDYKGCNAYHRDGRWVSIGEIKPYTASLDAAMTLVPEGWPSVQVGRLDDGRAYAGIAGNDAHMMAEDEEEFYAGCDDAATPALALCAAVLRARASSSNDAGSV